MIHSYIYSPSKLIYNVTKNHCKLLFIMIVNVCCETVHVSCISWSATIKIASFVAWLWMREPSIASQRRRTGCLIPSSRRYLCGAQRVTNTWRPLIRGDDQTKFFVVLCRRLVLYNRNHMRVWWGAWAMGFGNLWFTTPHYFCNKSSCSCLMKNVPTHDLEKSATIKIKNSQVRRK
jgi:hypothetical protein